MKRLTEHIYLLRGSVQAGILVDGCHAALIDAPELPEGDIPQVLRALGVTDVECVYLTQHRRAYCGGLAQWTGERPMIYAARPEAELLAHASDVWMCGEGKYHRYETIPDCYSPLQSIAADGNVQDGVAFTWHGLQIMPIVFGALSHGDCAYVVTDGEQRVLFAGGLAMAEGTIHDVWSLQKALPNMMGYHGFLGGLPDWVRGMERVRTLKPTLLVGSYGGVSDAPAAVLDTLERRLLDYADAYSQISAVHHYFPQEVQVGFHKPLGLSALPTPAPTESTPSWLRRIGETTSYLLRSESGHAILIDAGDLEAVQTVQTLLERGEVASLDACWITHAHDDHLNALWALTSYLKCEVLTTAAVAEVCCQPSAWFLPALPDSNLKCRVLPDGYSWTWQEFTLTALHLPGQCVYHAGLIVQRGEDKLLLCGDSFAPTGLDDYCAENRNLPGAGRGYAHCVDLLERYGVTRLINEHQTEAFCYDAAYLEHLRRGMARRERCLAALLPDDIGLGTDKQWLRAWPMEQTVLRGEPLQLHLQLTGHGRHEIQVRPRLPWKKEPVPALTARTMGLTSGTVTEGGDVPRDMWLRVDCGAAPQPGRYAIGFDTWLDGAYLGTQTILQLNVL